MDLLNIAFGLFGVVGLCLTIYYGIKTKQFDKLQKTLSWEKLYVVIDSIYYKMKKDKFTPDIMIAPGLRGGILAELLLNKYHRNIPVFVGISFRDIENPSNKLKLDNFQNFNIDDDWEILISNAILKFKDKKVLIVDDFCLTGNYFKNIRSSLVEKGFRNENIKVFCSVVTQVTISANRAPDYYSIITDDDHYYFPWGKANMG